MEQVGAPLAMYCMAATSAAGFAVGLATLLVLLVRRFHLADFVCIAAAWALAGTVVAVALGMLYGGILLVPDDTPACSVHAEPSETWAAWTVEWVRTVACAAASWATRAEKTFAGRSVIRAALPSWAYS